MKPQAGFISPHSQARGGKLGEAHREMLFLKFNVSYVIRGGCDVAPRAVLTQKTLSVETDTCRSRNLKKNRSEKVGSASLFDVHQKCKKSHNRPTVHHNSYADI